MKYDFHEIVNGGSVNNYFKVGKHEIFFFNDQSNRSANDAYDAARRMMRSFPDSRLSIYRQIHAELTPYVIGETLEIVESSPETAASMPQSN